MDTNIDLDISENLDVSLTYYEDAPPLKQEPIDSNFDYNQEAVETNFDLEGEPVETNSNFVNSDETWLKNEKPVVKDENKPYNCNKCDKRYGREDKLQHHIKTVHEGIKPFKCNECDSAFKSQTGLKYHVAEVHDDKKSSGQTAHISVLV